MRLSRRSVVTREGWYYLFILAFVVFGSLLRHIDLLVGLSAILAVAMLLNWRMTKASLRQVWFQRREKEAVWCNQPTVFEVEVENGRRQLSSFSVMVSQDFRPKRLLSQQRRDFNFFERIVRWFQGSSIKNYVLLDSVHVEECRIAQQTLEFRDRGEYEMGPLIISTHFPLGLVRRELTDSQRLPLFVGPALGKLSYGWVDRMLGLGWQDASGGTTARSGDEFFSLRPFVSGDSRRWIHWRASARHGSMLVRQFQRSQSKAFSMVVDLFALQDHQPKQTQGSWDRPNPVAENLTPTHSQALDADRSQRWADGQAANSPAGGHSVLSDQTTEDILRILATISDSVYAGQADTASLYLVSDQVYEIAFPCTQTQWNAWHQSLSTVSATTDPLAFFRFLKSQGDRIGLSGMGNASPVVVLSPRTLDEFASEVQFAQTGQTQQANLARTPDGNSPGEEPANPNPQSGLTGSSASENSPDDQSPFEYSAQDFWQIQRQIRTWLTPGDSRLTCWYLDAPKWQDSDRLETTQYANTANLVEKAAPNGDQPPDKQNSPATVAGQA